MIPTIRRLPPFGAAALLALTACASPPDANPAAESRVRPQYDSATGRLEALVVERPDDGSIEARAEMDGAKLVRIEIDTTGDGRFDRWEYYAGGAAPGAGLGTIVRAEQAARPDAAISRWEFYANGVIARVEEDTTGDGRVDKWERYEDGVLRSVDLDLSDRGRADRRFVYGANGSVESLELP
jgi:hypothetical protein